MSVINMSDNLATFKHALRLSTEDTVWFAVLLDFANLNPVDQSCVYAAHHHIAVSVGMYHVTFLHAVLIAEVSKYAFSTLVAQYLALSPQCFNLAIDFLDVLVYF